MTRNLIAITLLPLSIVLVAVGIAQTVVAALTLQRLHQNERAGTQLDLAGAGSAVPSATIYYVPTNVQVSLIHNEVSSGALAIAQGIFLFFWALSERDNDKAQCGRAMPNVVSFFVSGLTTAVFVLFCWTYAETYLHHDLPFAFPPPNNGDARSWNYTHLDDSLPWETWVCRFEPFFAEDNSYRWWQGSCALNMASRWLLVPLVILMITCALLAYFQIAVALRRIRSRRVSPPMQKA